MDVDNANGVAGSDCNALRNVNFTQYYNLNLDQLGVADNPKPISLREGESFRLQGLVAIFDDADPDSSELSEDCGRAPVYIPSSIVGFGDRNCFARMNEVFNYDDFISKGATLDSLTYESASCDIELTYTLER